MIDEHFKQDTPKQQSVGLIQGIEGHLRNWKNGIPVSENATDNAMFLLGLLKKLCLSQLPENWVLENKNEEQTSASGDEGGLDKATDAS